MTLFSKTGSPIHVAVSIDSASLPPFDLNQQRREIIAESPQSSRSSSPSSMLLVPDQLEGPRPPSPNHFLKHTKLVHQTSQEALSDNQPLSALIARWVGKIKKKIESSLDSTFINNKINALLKPIFERRGLDFEKMQVDNDSLNSATAQEIEKELSDLPLIVRLAEKIGDIKSKPEKDGRSLVQQLLDKAFKGEDQTGRAYSNLHFNEFDLFMPHAHSLEILSLYFAYSAQEEVEVPISTDQGFVFIPYKLETIPIIGGFEAFGLVPKNINPSHPAILLFAGTTLNFLDNGIGARLIADFDPTGPGFMFFNVAYSDLEAWLKKNSDLDKGRKVIVTGHSLGGNLAAYTAAYLGEYVRECYTFASPAFSPFAARKWEERSEKPLLINFSNADDFVPSWGYERFGQDVVIHVNEEASETEQESIKKGSFASNHRFTALDNDSLLVNSAIELTLPRWMQLALQIVVFLVLSPLWIFIVAWWLVFGHAKSIGFTYLLYPVNLLIEECCTNIKSMWNKAFPPVPLPA